MSSKKIAVITDSTCDLSDVILKKYDIEFVPIRINYPDRTYKDRIDITAKEIYDRMPSEIPQSSLPSAEDILAVFDRVAAKGYTDAIMISVSSGLSGTHNMFRMMIEEYDKMNITLIDSKMISTGLGFLVLEAARAVKDKKNISEILEIVKATRKSMTGLFVVKTLLYLRKGGRIGKVEGTVGEMLHIKPIITIGEDGVYHTLAKSRGRKKAISKMVDLFTERYKDKIVTLGVVHGNDESYARQILETLKSRLNIKEIVFDQVSPVLGVHTGPGLIGLIGYESE